MLLELIDSLRCPASHEETWLVASVDAWRGAHVARGVLGCPICRAEYPIADGVIDFTRSGSAPALSADAGAGTEHAEVLRLAAQLDLREPGGLVLLAGCYAPLAAWLQSVTAAQYVVVATAGAPIPRGAETGLVVGERLPLAAQTVRAAALDAAAAQEPLLTEFTRVLRPEARLVAAASVPVPPRVRELARDEREWVGAADGAVTAPVPLRRR